MISFGLLSLERPRAVSWSSGSTAASVVASSLSWGGNTIKLLKLQEKLQRLRRKAVLYRQKVELLLLLTTKVVFVEVGPWRTLRMLQTVNAWLIESSHLLSSRH